MNTVLRQLHIWQSLNVGALGDQKKMDYKGLFRRGCVVGVLLMVLPSLPSIAGYFVCCSLLITLQSALNCMLATVPSPPLLTFTARPLPPPQVPEGFVGV